MKHMTLERIAECCNGTYFGEEAKKTAEVTGIAIDSRKMTKGGLFVPIQGAKRDGHEFIDSVMEEGALACLSERVLEHPKGPYILVKSAPEALKRMAAFYRQTLGIPVVGVIGSVGKTSTKEMIASVLKEKFRVHKTEGNYNNEIGLPLTIFDITSEHEIAVLEMGISDFGEMHRLAEVANPDICVITNIGLCHLENLKDRDGILKAKTEVFDHLRGEGIVILNGDDDKLATVKEVNGKRPVFYGMNGVTAFASELEPLELEGIRTTLHLNGISKRVTIPIPGTHTVYNALAAACVGNALGMELDAICRGIETVETISGRSHRIEQNGITVMDDCYNANPVSMHASIDVLSQVSGRKIAVLGDMGELGEREREFHREIGAYVVQKRLDVLYCTGDLCQEMAQEAARCSGGITDVRYFKTKEGLIGDLLSEVKQGDTLLIKASHAMEFSEIVKRLTTVG